MRSKSVLNGVNVPIAPTANTDNHLTNNISIKNYLAKDSENAENRDEVVTVEERTETVETTTETTETVTTTQERSVQKRELATNDLDKFLLELYQTVLLNDNKKLLANMISKNKIILTKEDLETAVSKRIGLPCTIEYDEPEITCFGANPIFLKVTSIRVFNDDETYSDLQVQFNKEYVEMSTTYHLCMAYVLTN